ncbi:MAG: hypothetical protein NTZ90_09755 [Proteobacteria bacterium]|nr:hypothetical protein [Pseudomonadota bacterium]
MKHLKSQIWHLSSMLPAARAWLVKLSSSGLALACLTLMSSCAKDSLPLKRKAVRAELIEQPQKDQGAADINQQSCSMQSHTQWQHFLDAYAHDDRWGKTCEQDCDAEYAQFVQQRIQNTFTTCADVLHADPVLTKCTANFRGFVSSWLQLHAANSYGFNLSNDQYHQSQEATDKPPGMMTVPSEIIAALPERSQVEHVARRQGWKYLTHVSAIRGTRTMIYIPDSSSQFDRWLLINYEHDPDRVDAHSEVAFLAVQKQSRSGQKLSRFPLRFRDYHVSQSSEGYQLSLSRNFSGKCFACHPSGVRPLIDIITPQTSAKPVSGESDFNQDDAAPAPAGFARRRLDEFNAILASYGLPDWEGMIAPETLGPALGGAQGCTNCHDGKRRGALSIVTSWPHIEQKIASELSMPPQRALTRLVEKKLMHPDEFHAADAATLAAGIELQTQTQRAFAAERLPALVAWLTEHRCD